ncbi:MAG: ABC transporter permease [Deltaproteobacteria bacterium]|nr:MAG: ABC transporter permease [Deltaproteobacteria bacterium]
MKFWDVILAWRFFRDSSRGRFFSVSFRVAVLGMSFGVMALLLSLAITEGFTKEYERAVLGSHPHIVINSEDDVNNPDAIEKIIQASAQKISIPIKNIEPVIYREGMLIGGKSIKGLVLKGVPPHYFEKSGIKIISRAVEKNENHLPEIFLGKAVAEESGIKTGIVKLLFPKTISQKSLGKMEISPKDLKSFFLAGIFETGVYEMDSTFGILDLETAKNFFHLGETISGFETWIENPQEASRLVEKIREELSFPYEVLSWREINENIFKAMETEKWMFGVLMLVLVVVASLNVLGTLMMLLLKKRREIAILRTLGYSWSRLRKVFLIDGLLIGMTGTGLGIFFGLLCEFILKHWQPFALDPEVYFLKTVPVTFCWDHIFLVFGASLGIGVLGCMLTLKKISQVSTLTILEKS